MGRTICPSYLFQLFLIVVEFNWSSTTSAIPPTISTACSCAFLFDDIERSLIFRSLFIPILSASLYSLLKHLPLFYLFVKRFFWNSFSSLVYGALPNPSFAIYFTQNLTSVSDFLWIKSAICEVTKNAFKENPNSSVFYYHAGRFVV